MDKCWTIALPLICISSAPSEAQMIIDFDLDAIEKEELPQTHLPLSQRMSLISEAMALFSVPGVII